MAMAAASTRSSRARGGGGGGSSASAAARPGVRVYQRNVFVERVKQWLVWLALNFRYAIQWLISVGGRLEHLPKRSERPLVSMLVFIWGALLGLGTLAGLLTAHQSLFSPGTYMTLGLGVAYVVGAYLLIMEHQAAEEMIGLAFILDFLLLPSGLLGRGVKLLIFALFLLICVKDWRRIVRLPERPPVFRGR